jgi:hypothetical protein
MAGKSSTRKEGLDAPQQKLGYPRTFAEDYYPETTKKHLMNVKAEMVPSKRR